MVLTLDSSVVANLIILGLSHACSIQFLKCKDSAVYLLQKNKSVIPNLKFETWQNCAFGRVLRHLGRLQPPSFQFTVLE
jgi:hypothetical protein